MGLGCSDARVGTRSRACGRYLKRRKIGRVAGPKRRLRNVQLQPWRIPPYVGILVAHVLSGGPLSPESSVRQLAMTRKLYIDGERAARLGRHPWPTKHPTPLPTASRSTHAALISMRTC